MSTPSPSSNFDLELAFSRNLGWLTAQEQRELSKLHVGIAGLGGVGGQYAEILTRLGVGTLTLYDADQFSVENTNRQNECRVSNYGRNKVDAIAALVRDINPQAQVNAHSRRLELSDVDAFCKSIDIYLDSLDFFVTDIRIAIFRKMRELGKPALTVAPIGTGAACLVFTRDSMSFDDYFGLHLTEDKTERAFRFLLGLAPSLMQTKYVADRSRVNLEGGKAPSLPMGVYSCASYAATTILKLILNRGPVALAPRSVHYDPYLVKLKKTNLFGGYRNPVYQLKLWILKKMYAARK